MARLTGPYSGFPGDSTRRTTTAELPLGTRAYSPDGAEFVYVKAGAAIAQYDAVTFQGSTLGYDDVRKTSAADQFVLGVADAAFSSGDYGFLQTKGICTAKVVNSTTAGKLLGSCATAGVLDDPSASSLAGATPAVALVTGVATGSAIALR